MCGDHPRQSYGGALAVLSLPIRSTRSTPFITTGRLTFHDRGQGGTVATHATFVPDGNDTAGSVDLETCIVGIHETGDLTRSAIISPFLHKFSMTQGCPEPDGRQRSMEVELSHPMKIEVGGDGIIGRRVTMWAPNAMDPVAEGIIGYN
ncbi:hypothetical protein F4779DRAFT_543233 [Xylariaceae sp. FL0662B]|nr:hypothetical protein F4779DRAFT_543233 [Xylariaceae sp. FL0662B]